MWNLLQLLFVGHIHKWKILREGKMNDTYENIRVGTVYELQCEKCGNVKRTDLLAND